MIGDATYSAATATVAFKDGSAVCLVERLGFNSYSNRTAVTASRVDLAPFYFTIRFGASVLMWVVWRRV